MTDEYIKPVPDIVDLYEAERKAIKTEVTHKSDPTDEWTCETCREMFRRLNTPGHPYTYLDIQHLAWHNGHQERVEQLQRERDVARQALRFYADPKTWEGMPIGHEWGALAEVDAGDKARKALGL